MAKVKKKTKQKTDKDAIIHAQMVSKAIDLRVAGCSYEEILAELNHWKSIQACQKAVAAALKKLVCDSGETYRQILVRRKERIILPLLEKADKGNLLADDRIIKIDDQIAKLIGAYAPTKIAETDAKGNDKPQVVFYLPDNNRDNQS